MESAKANIPGYRSNNNQVCLKKKTIFVILLALLIFFILKLFFPSLNSIIAAAGFLSIHSLLEYFSVTVAIVITLQSNVLFSHSLSRYQLLIGLLFFTIAMFDLLHILTYRGMPNFITVSSTQKATWFWITARFTGALGLFLIFIMNDKKCKRDFRWLIFPFAIIVILFISFIIIKFSNHFPVLVIEGYGTTIIKNILEYTVIGLYAFTIFTLFKKYKFDPNQNSPYVTLIAAFVFLSISDLMFTHYLTVYDFYNVLGHIYKVVGFGFLLKGLYLKTIEEPYFKSIKVQKELEKSKNHLQTITDSLGEGVLVCDTSCIAVFMNPEAEKLLGWKLSEIQNNSMHLHDVIYYSQHDHAYLNASICPMSETLITGKINRVEEDTLHRKDGTTFIASHISSPIYENGIITGIVTIFRDITERKKTEEFIHRSDKLYAVGELAAGVAHEIRNPLTSLKGFAQILKTRVNNLNDKEFIDIMLNEIDRINFIVSEFMTLAKPRDLNLSKNSLEEMLNHIVALLQTQAILKNIQIYSAFDISNVYIFCEKNQIKQVFVNILKNAIEAMPSGGEITINAKRKDDNVVITFIDQGIGIPEEKLKQVGQPFYTTKETGTGLGLMVSNSIIKNHNGTMQIHSEINIGTTIEIELPIEYEVQTKTF